ncbi:MAG: gliding motility-associated C-terminal domain-containing protein, partial [Ferruginibacter sp.]|nr:gliding motility-associated C-terminal domain-containing protein [Cytophagales bacterium]
EFFTYEWFALNRPNVKIGEGQILPLGAGTYLVRFTNDPGCQAQDTIQVVDRCEPILWVPQAFSPNGDGTNDTFDGLFPAHLKNLDVRVYNRWGEVVTATKIATPDFNNAVVIWDGTFKGKPSPVGSYVWTVTYESTDFPDRPPVKRRGGVALIR